MIGANQDLRELFVRQHFEQALYHHYIKVYYQPIIRTLTGEISGVEALSRWIDPEHGYISPAEFIPELEKQHRISELDLYVLREICQDLKERERRGLPVVPVSINLSRSDFEECDICQEVDHIITEYEIPRELICLELTESLMMSSPEVLRAKIDWFRDKGYSVWMDDFGSGYSSLNVLKDFTFDVLKLDMLFLSSLTHKSKNVLKSMVSMAKTLGIHTLAEGVEEQEQLEFLKSIGCERVQGYIFSKPLPAEELNRNEYMKSHEWENSAVEKYQDLIGTLDVITDRPIALVEFNSKAVSIQYKNEPFRSFLISIDADNMEKVYQYINSDTSEFFIQLQRLKKICHVGSGIQEIVHRVKDFLIFLRVKCLAEDTDRSAYYVELAKLTDMEIDESEFRNYQVVEQRKAQNINLEAVWSTYEELSEIVYAADMDTHELLFINRTAREMMGYASLESLQGTKCYKVIQGQEAPCEFCNNRYLLNSKPKEFDFFHPKYNTQCYIRDQMLICNGRKIRIEIVRMNSRGAEEKQS